MKNQDNFNIKVVDLFCGIGGITHGFVKENISVVAGYDIDSTCRFAYESNNKGAEFISKDIKKVTGKELKNKFAGAEYTVLVGCAPCQPFSTYSHKRPEDDKWELLNEFSRIIKEVKPDIVSMENVPRLVNFTIFDDFKSTLKKNGYQFSYKIVSCASYGVPQNRKRLVLIASKLGSIELIPETHNKDNYITVKDAIGKLPPINNGESYSGDFIHRSNKLSEINYLRIRNTKEGGSWKDWDDSLKLKCHLKPTGKSYGSVYGRMWWNKPSPTITTHCVGLGNGRFGHPEQDRAISLREAAILQTFPKTYKFVKTQQDLKVRQLAIHIGNAVPVRLGEVIAQSIKLHLSKITQNNAKQNRNSASNRRKDKSN